MINISRAKLALSSFLITSSLFAQTGKLQEEKELEVVNFNTIKQVLEKDGLSESARRKAKEVKILKKEQSKIEEKRFFYPVEQDLWGFVSEFWLVKNAQLLNWDFTKPDYGLDTSFSNLMEKLGFYQKKYKILLLNTPSLVRAALPGNNGEGIFLLSVPFIRTMDLSKLEISLLLFEDFLRLEEGYLKKSVETPKVKKLAGTSFQGKKPDLSFITELSKNYSERLMVKGFTFQQQFEITKKMDGFLKSNPELWNAYFQLLGKIDRFVKSNNQYKDYSKLYPSPEMQQKWLSPPEKVL